MGIRKWLIVLFLVLITSISVIGFINESNSPNVEVEQETINHAEEVR
ncbi:hypothetical protein [Aquibacillus albus]|uniref:Uncharacterized protein n=1 Tax=Aquibacillus albus TaxID=1168171 RepID=A0ABS2MXK5_9BACI|nr:hypothetical protein [Aquibacillus albus]MBM7570624.1 hypothetical protein [Aquibacillus albus]